MKTTGRVTLCLGLLTAGVAAQAALENASKIERPLLRRPLATLPMELGDWIGKSQEIRADILDQSQATECISRLYVNPRYPGVGLSLWINYSDHGTNMRHSPDICLPSHGSTKIESMSKVLAIPATDGKEVSISRLAYAQAEAELVSAVGFWYYIFGEGRVERWVRGLPITSRSSHGRTTRGSGLTVEVFWRNDVDPDSEAFRDFARALIGGLDPIMPTDRADYFVP
jgi:Protein of unknown function (DUF3485)